MSSADHSDKMESKNGGVTWKWLVGAIIISLVVVLVALYFLPDNTEITHSYFMRYYDNSFPTQIRSLSMDTDIITVQNNATLKVELTDDLSNDQKKYVVEVIPEDVARDGYHYFWIAPNRHGNISFEHEPRQTFSFMISPVQFGGICTTENLVVNLYEYYDNGTTNNTPIDVEKIPIISHYPKGSGKVCY